MKNQFVKSQSLDMELILTKFMQYYEDIYGNSSDKFLEDNGKKQTGTRVSECDGKVIFEGVV